MQKTPSSYGSKCAEMSTRQRTERGSSNVSESLSTAGRRQHYGSSKPRTSRAPLALRFPKRAQNWTGSEKAQGDEEVGGAVSLFSQADVKKKWSAFLTRELLGTRKGQERRPIFVERGLFEICRAPGAVRGASLRSSPPPG